MFSLIKENTNLCLMSDIPLSMLTRVLSLLEKDEHYKFKLLRKDGKMYNQVCIGSLNTIIEYLNNKYDLLFKMEILLNIIHYDILSIILGYL